MEITSSAFVHFGHIPKKYTCEDENISPPLSIADVPDTAQALVLIADDPDAPGTIFTHWVVWNIDPRATNIPEGELPMGAIEGQNDAGSIGYTGPCPPPGPRHRYFFKLYALDKILELRPDSTKAELVNAMSDHVLVETDLVGLYQRQEVGV